ncbi:hypothetical protein NO1_1947 [Candidatus Termititenax aidoneus]|uniref:Lipoprotein n=1 Tax=Termititenax aidoneus TaxID=2218524 RepID=A0A388TD54_TERA1|nr:hypothetical protein NO1_1947 [Candidatus Termititenax aidoneus]
MSKKILATGLFLIMCLITGCTSTTNLEALKKIKNIGIPLKTVTLRPHKLVLESGSNFIYNLDPKFGLENKMLSVEKEFLDRETAKIENQLSILNMGIKKITNNSTNTKHNDEHVYYSNDSISIDFTDKENIKKLCAINNVDALGCINIEFHKVLYDEPFVGSFIKMRAKAIVKLFANSGEEIFFREITGESAAKLAQDFKLTVSIPLIETGGLAFKQDVDFRNDTEIEEYLLNSFNLRNNYAVLYEDALTKLRLKIQDELNTVSAALL